MPSPVVNHLSIASLSLTLYSDDEAISSATGFVVDHDGKSYLVTNWHVFAGVDQITGMNLDKRGLHPTRVAMMTFTAPDPSSIFTASYSLPLIDDDHEVLWRMHGEFGSRVDVAVLPLPAGLKLEYDPVDLHKLDHSEDASHVFHISVADPVVIVGYPLNLDGGAPFVAVWVQGTIASEYHLDVGDYPRFLVDARTRQGMSGSPVYYYPRGRTAYFTDGTSEFLVRDASQILGIYSGRAHAESDLGFVWRKSLIDVIITSGVQGSIHAS